MSTKLPDTKLTYSLWVLAIASMSKYIVVGTVFYLRPSVIAGPIKGCIFADNGGTVRFMYLISDLY